MRRSLFFLVLLLWPALACNFVSGGSDPIVTGTAVLLVQPTHVSPATETPSTSTTLSDISTPSGVVTPKVLTTLDASLPTTETAGSPTPTATAPQPTATCIARSAWPVYTVQVGDTLFDISQRANTTVDELVIANCLPDRNQIVVGQTLYVPVTLTKPTPFPTLIPDGENPVIYPSEGCFSDPFPHEIGVAVGERWRVSDHQDVLTVFSASTSNITLALIQKGETLTILEGPYCYTKVIDSDQLAFRRWRISSEGQGVTGWIDELDVFTDVSTISPAPKVIKFTASPQVIKTGDPITIEWEVEGANEINIFSYHSLHRFASDMITQDPWLPPSGSMTVTAQIPLTSIQYSLGFAPEDPEHWATVQILCTEEFFADAGDLHACPLDPPTTLEATFQSFESGFMMWKSNTNTIWVFVEETPGSHVFNDTWAGEEITFDGVPPEGLVQPVRGFGKVWVENPWVQRSLGWGTAVEQAYMMELQKTHTGYAASRYFFSLPDGRLVDASLYHGTSLSWKFTTRAEE